MIESMLDVYAHVCPHAGKLGSCLEDMAIKLTHIRLRQFYCLKGTPTIFALIVLPALPLSSLVLLFVRSLCMISSPPRRKLLKFLSSSPVVSNPRSRERWSRASRGCGSARDGLRASGASPTSPRQCTSCCSTRVATKLFLLYSHGSLHNNVLGKGCAGCGCSDDSIFSGLLFNIICVRDIKKWFFRRDVLSSGGFVRTVAIK